MQTSPLLFRVLLVGATSLLPAASILAQPKPLSMAGGASVLAPDALLSTPVGGLERTQSKAQVVPAAGQPFERALRIAIGAEAAETNATQLTMPNAAAVEKGDALLASFSVRGAAAEGKGPAHLEFLFEKSSAPWSKSVSMGVSTWPASGVWKRVLVPFVSGASYAPGEVMASLRLAFGPQTLEVGGLSIQDFGKSQSLEQLVALAAEQNPLGQARVALRLQQARQTLLGFGGNFTKPRYGATEPLDKVAQFNLDKLSVKHARIGLPLNFWAPQPGVYKDEAQAHAAFLQMQAMATHHIPITLSVWEGPLWMLPGEPEKGRALPRDKYLPCAEAIAQFLLTARDKYHAEAQTFSFNEADYGVNFKFSSSEITDFIRVAGPHFAALGLKTKFLVGDTANGANCVDYVRPLLEDKSLAPFLGPLAFHSWDVMSAPDLKYLQIAALGRQFNKPVWCTEAGHDSQLWQAPNPWPTWDNALKTALAYERTLRLSGAELIDYWTYENDYPLLSADGQTPFPVWQVVRQMQDALPSGYTIGWAQSSSDDLKVLPSVELKPNRFSILLINPIGPGTAMLEGLPPNASVSVVRSTEQAQNVAPKADRVGRGGRLAVELPARSVVTVAGQSELDINGYRGEPRSR